MMIKSSGGDRFWANLDQRIYWELFFTGTYEPELSWLLRKVLRPGDTVVDAGANFGWFTVLCAHAVGPQGSVHSFEPLPVVHADLLLNVESNGITCVKARNLALGSSPGKLDLHIFANLGPAHSSISSLGRDDFTVFTVDVTTLDNYASENMFKAPTLIKCDVEGAELAILEGSTDILSGAFPPIWVLEINYETAGALGYGPDALTDHLKAYGYSFFRIGTGCILSVTKGSECSHGEMLLAVVDPEHSDRLSTIEQR